MSGTYIMTVTSPSARAFPLISVTVLDAKENTVELVSLAKFGMDLMASRSASDS